MANKTDLVNHINKFRAALRLPSAKDSERNIVDTTLDIHSANIVYTKLFSNMNIGLPLIYPLSH